MTELFVKTERTYQNLQGIFPVSQPAWLCIMLRGHEGKYETRFGDIFEANEVLFASWFPVLACGSLPGCGNACCIATNGGPVWIVNNPSWSKDWEDAETRTFFTATSQDHLSLPSELLEDRKCFPLCEDFESHLDLIPLSLRIF